MTLKKIKSALISVYKKEGVEKIIEVLHSNQVKIISTGGTRDFIESMGIPVTSVEEITSFPPILGGRVKTLHPSVFGAILHRRDNMEDLVEISRHSIPEIDMVLVDLYPFAETVRNNGSDKDIIEKIDIGGVSLIRAASKNFNDILVISKAEQYNQLYTILSEQECSSNIEQRKLYAAEAFSHTACYDSEIAKWFGANNLNRFHSNYENPVSLRYGENPHQKAVFYENQESFYEVCSGKLAGYNNLNDMESAFRILHEFDEETVCVIIKHTNACGFSIGTSGLDAYEKALAGDPVSAFGGIIAINNTIHLDAAQKINELFFEILIARDFEDEALRLLQSKKNRILVKYSQIPESNYEFKSVLNGVLVQESDNIPLIIQNYKTVTKKQVKSEQLKDLLIAEKIIRNLKSNSIVLVKNGQLLGAGCGMTSRIDALRHAISKAGESGFELGDSVMASDAFFPFPDCVELAGNNGISAIVQPGGSIKDQLSIDYCDSHDMAMVFNGIRHFRH